MNTHYVYRITNTKPTDTRKYYIGVRTADNGNPKEDLKYMGSSDSLKEAIGELGLENFSKEILSTWETREQANLEEIRLHWEIDVASHPEYYNRANATSTGFCRCGQVTVIDTRDGKTKDVSKEDFENTDYYVSISKGKVPIIDEYGIKRMVLIEEYNSNEKLTHLRKNQVPVFDTKTGLTTSVSKEEFENNDRYQHVTAGQVTVTDTRDGTTKNVLVEEFEKCDYYVGNTAGQVTVLDAENGLTKNITVEEYHQNKNRYFTSCRGKIPAINKTTGHKTLMSEDELLLQSEYELFSATKGMVVVKDIRDNSSKLVTQEEYQTHDYYVATNTGRVNVVDLRDGKTKQVSKEEFDSCDYYQSALVGQVTVIDTRDGLTKNVSKDDFDKFDYYTSIMEGKLVVLDTRDNTTKHVTKEDFHNCDYYVSLGSKKIGIFNKDGVLQYSTWGNFKKLCRELGLPYNALGESLRNNSNPIPLSTAKNAVTRFISSGYEPYFGWFAKELN